MDGETEFVDSNVIVYAHDRNAGDKRNKARELLSRLDSTGSGALSVQVLQEFVVTAGQKVKQPLPYKDLQAILEDLSDWIVFCPGPADVLDALSLSQRFHFSFWDAMIVQASLQVKAATLWSEDLSDGQDYGGVVVRNPFKGTS